MWFILWTPALSVSWRKRQVCVYTHKTFMWIWLLQTVWIEQDPRKKEQCVHDLMNFIICFQVNIWHLNLQKGEAESRSESDLWLITIWRLVCNTDYWQWNNTVPAAWMYLLHWCDVGIYHIGLSGIRLLIWLVWWDYFFNSRDWTLLTMALAKAMKIISDFSINLVDPVSCITLYLPIRIHGSQYEPSWVSE